MAEYIVKNISGTSEKKTKGYNSWIDKYWEILKSRKSGINQTTECHKIGCSGNNAVGAHVKIVEKTNRQYIVPLCAECNHTTNTEKFKVKGPLVPVVEKNRQVKY